MSKIETQPKASTTHPAGHDCCGGASAGEPSSKSSKPAEPEAAGHPAPSAPAKMGCCCGGAKTDPNAPKR